MKRIISFLLSIVMIFGVVGVVDSSVYADSSNTNDNKQYSMFKSDYYYRYFNFDTPSFAKEYYEEMKNDAAFMKFLTTWEAGHIATSPSHAMESGMITLKEYYKAVIFDLFAQSSSGTGLTDQLLKMVTNSELSYIVSITKTITKPLEKDNLDSISVDEAKNALENSAYQTSKWFGVVSKIAKWAKSSKELIEAFSKYLAIADLNDGTKEILAIIANDSQNPIELREAAADCISYFGEGYEKVLNQIEAGTWDIAVGVFTTVANVALDWAWGMIAGAITTATGGAIGSAILLAAKGIRVFSNFLFNVDKDVESFYQIKAGVVCEDAMKRVIAKLNSQGYISNNLENSIIYNSAVDAFQKTILLGFDYSIGLLQNSAETPAVKYTSQYDEYMNLIEQIRTFKKNKQKIYSKFEDKCLDSYKKAYCLDFDKICALLDNVGNISNADDRTHQVEEFDFDYSITNGKVTIQRFTAYDGKYRHISIPSKIEGFPVTKIATNAFKYSTIESVIIPITVLEIEENVFEGCNKLRKIVLINDNIKLDGSSFNNTINAPEIIIYCNNNSSGKDFCEKNEGFDYQPLNYDGINLWKVAPLDGEYHIHIGSELAYLSRVVDGGTDLNDYTIILENDINMGSNPIIPIGTSEKCPYRGSFDGNNYTINNLNITTTNNLNALFGYVISGNSQFKNVEIDGKLNERDSYGAGLIARTDVTDGKLSISNISISLNDSGIYGYHKGGIVGEISSNGNSNVVLKKCINKGHIESFSAYGDNVTGGLVGSYNATASDNLSFIQCANTGFVKSDSRYQSAGVTCGGLLGQVVSGNIIFSECLVDGNIQAKAGWITLGGFIGFASPNSLKISNCEMFANIKPIGIGSGLRIVGALIADLSYENTNSDSKFVIENSYVSSALTTKEAGYTYVEAAFINSKSNISNEKSISIKNSYFDKDKLDKNADIYKSKSDLLVGYFKNFDGMKVADMSDWNNSKICSSYILKNDRALYNEWDTENIWSFCETGYPILRAFSNIEPCSSHSFSQKIIKPTCTEKGYTIFTCNNCGYVYYGNEISATNHKYSFTKTVLPTCTTQGYDLYTCSVCSSTEKRNTVKVLEHSYEILSHKDSTCNTAGYDEYKCTMCSNIKKDEIAVLDGSALTASLEKAQTYLAKDYFTNESIAVLQNVYNSHINDLDTLTTQEAVDNATAEINTAINELVLGDYASGETDDGIRWKWERNTGVLTVSGTGSISGYTSTTMPWYDVINYATEIVVSDGITSIGKYAFYKAENAQKISLPDTLTTINERAFEYCSSVEELIIPDTVNQIGYGTFANMTNLKKVTVPASTTYRSYCFDNDKAIEEIKITYGIDGTMPIANVTAEQSYILDVFYKRTGSFGPWKYAENAVVKIEDGVSKIGDKAFYYCLGIENIELPDTVTEIGTGNFVSTDAATEITILNPNCSIQEGSFTGSNTIIGYSNSTAEVFADNNSIPFKAIDEHIHTYGEWTYNGDAEYISSSNYKNGTQTRTCSVCGAEETVEAPNTALLRRRGNALALESSITLTTYITKDIVDYYDEVYAEFTRNGRTEIVFASDKTFNSDSTVYNIFDYAGISPQAMGDDIEIKFYGIKDGVKYWGETYTYSVTTYVTSTLSKSTTSAKLKTMLVDLMYYGEACQIYQNYKTDSLMTHILTDEQKQLRSTGELNLTNIKDSSYTTCENRLVRFGTALRLNNAVEIAIPLNMTNVTLEELTFKVKIGSRDLTYTYSDNPENFEKGKDGYWYFYFDGVYANQMSDEVLITAYRGDEQVSYTLKYSVESYAATVTDSKLKKVTDAMMRYGNSAKAYSGK